jgi:hypothetical protein
VVAHYDRFHKVIDLLDYLSIAVETGVLATGDVAQFVTQNALVTGGCELGVYPRDWLIATLTQLETVGKRFLDRHASRIMHYDDYNVRALRLIPSHQGTSSAVSDRRSRRPLRIHLLCRRTWVALFGSASVAGTRLTVDRIFFFKSPLP